MAKHSTPLISLGNARTISTVEFLERNCNVEMVEVDTPQGKREEACFVFRTNEGKGSGPQIWRLSEMDDNLSRIREIHNKGYEAASTEAGYVPGPKVITDTIAIVEVEDDHGETVDHVRFRNRNGKGSKPASVPKDEMPEFIEALSVKIETVRPWAIAQGFLDASEDASEDLSEDLSVG